MTEFQVNTGVIGNQSKSTVAIDASGNFVICWQSDVQDGTEIYAQLYNSDGVAQGAEFHVNTYTTGIVDNSIAVAMDATGNFVISWNGFDQGDINGIYARRYDNNGVAEGAEFQVNTDIPSFQANPTVAMDATGNFVISWTSFNQDGSSYEIYAKSYNSVGIAQGGEFQVNSTIDGCPTLQ